MSDLRFTPLVGRRWAIPQNYIIFAPHRENVLEILQIPSMALLSQYGLLRIASKIPIKWLVSHQFLLIAGT